MSLVHVNYKEVSILYIGSLSTVKWLKNGRDQHKVSVSLGGIHLIEVSVKRDLTVLKFAGLESLTTQ